jgi:poly(A) polymerase
MVDPGVLHIVRRLRERGYRALLAGGCVRDWLMGRAPKDWDVATDADPQAVMGLFPRTVPVGVRFGIVVVVLEEGRYEVARFRRDSRYLDGRHPEGVAFADPEADARRRDFTINGLFYDPVEERLIDYVGGRKDIEGKVIRAIGDPEQRFAEDYLRLLRAVRFAARFAFRIEAATWAAIQQLAERIEAISAERSRDELIRILTEGDAVQGLQLLLDSGLLRYLLPEVAAMEGVEQPPEFHPEGDVWTHVKRVFAVLPEPGHNLAWGALLHDIGKPPTFSLSDRIRFNNHETVGAEMAAAVCRRLRMANDDTARICQLVGQHMRIRHVREMRPGKLKRFLREPYFPELLELHRADCLASHGNLELYEFCREKLAVESPAELHPPRLLTGYDLVAMGFTPGPLFGTILEAVEEEQLEGRVETREGAERFVRERFSSRRACRTPARGPGPGATGG